MDIFRIEKFEHCWNYNIQKPEVYGFEDSDLVYTSEHSYWTPVCI